VPSHLSALCLVHEPVGAGGRYRPQLRELVPCHCTAAGKALLAWRRPWREAVLAQQLERFTERTVTSPEWLRRELERTVARLRDRGPRIPIRCSRSGCARSHRRRSGGGRHRGRWANPAPTHRTLRGDQSSGGKDGPGTIGRPRGDLGRRQRELRALWRRLRVRTSEDAALTGVSMSGRHTLTESDPRHIELAGDPRRSALRMTGGGLRAWRSERGASTAGRVRWAKGGVECRLSAPPLQCEAAICLSSSDGRPPPEDNSNRCA
jgi:hypothetical protein